MRDDLSQGVVLPPKRRSRPVTLSALLLVFLFLGGGDAAVGTADDVDEVQRGRDVMRRGSKNDANEEVSWAWGRRKQRGDR